VAASLFRRIVGRTPEGAARQDVPGDSASEPSAPAVGAETQTAPAAFHGGVSERRGDPTAPTTVRPANGA
jgi:hypothetical protein